MISTTPEANAKLYLTLEPIPGFTLLFVEVDLTKDGYMLAGELAKHAGVSTDTLRHYERKRVLPGPRRSTSGYRMRSSH